MPEITTSEIVTNRGLATRYLMDMLAQPGSPRRSNERVAKFLGCTVGGFGSLLSGKRNLAIARLAALTAQRPGLRWLIELFADPKHWTQPTPLEIFRAMSAPDANFYQGRLGSTDRPVYKGAGLLIFEASSPVLGTNVILACGETSHQLRRLFQYPFVPNSQWTGEAANVTVTVAFFSQSVAVIDCYLPHLNTTVRVRLQFDPSRQQFHAQEIN